MGWFVSKPQHWLIQHVHDKTLLMQALMAAMERAVHLGPSRSESATAAHLICPLQTRGAKGPTRLPGVQAEPQVGQFTLFRW